MTDLERIFNNHTGNIIHKWDHYFDIYDRYLGRFRGKAPVIVEIGVFKGGSSQMWQEYFDKDARIIGVDINPGCKKFEKGNIEIMIGSQEDENFLQHLKSVVGKADVVIDDGGHTMNQLKISFNCLYDLVKDEGVYIAEDLHTCYWYHYDGGLQRPSNFIEYSKHIIDKMHEWYYVNGEVSSFAKDTYCVHYYDSIIVFEKRKREKPFSRYAGKIDSPEIADEHSPGKNYWKKFKFLLYKYTRINIP